MKSVLSDRMPQFLVQCLNKTKFVEADDPPGTSLLEAVKLKFADEIATSAFYLEW